MAIVISRQSWYELWRADRQNALKIDPEDHSDLIFACPREFGYGHKRDICLRNGIDLTFHRYQFYEDIILSGDFVEPSPCLEWVFNLSSIFRCGSDVLISNGQHYLIGIGLEGEVKEEFAKYERVEIDIHIEPMCFRNLINDRLDIVPPEMLPMLEGDLSVPFSAIGKITPAMQMTLQQMLNCPYRGVMKQIYLESKSLEMLTLWLDQALSQGDRPSLKPANLLNSEDLERIRHARDLLLQQVQNPPTLLDLARQVGINDCTLKRGFKQVFGNTVFGYLHQHRMEQARLLLLRQDQSISAIAQAVGYGSVSAFSTAFRKQFGVSPRAMQS